MSAADCAELAASRLDGELDDAAWASAQAEHGSALDQALTRERWLRQALNDLPRPPLPAGLRQNVLASAAAPAQPAPSPTVIRRRPGWWAGLASAAVAASLAVAVFLQPDPTATPSLRAPHRSQDLEMAEADGAGPSVAAEDRGRRSDEYKGTRAILPLADDPAPSAPGQTVAMAAVEPMAAVEVMAAMPATPPPAPALAGAQAPIEAAAARTRMRHTDLSAPPSAPLAAAVTAAPAEPLADAVPSGSAAHSDDLDDQMLAAMLAEARAFAEAEGPAAPTRSLLAELDALDAAADAVPPGDLRLVVTAEIEDVPGGPVLAVHVTHLGGDPLPTLDGLFILEGLDAAGDVRWRRLLPTGPGALEPDRTRFLRQTLADLTIPAEVTALRLVAARQPGPILPLDRP